MNFPIAARFIASALRAYLDEESPAIVSRRADGAIYALMDEGLDGSPALDRGKAIEAVFEAMEVFEKHALNEMPEGIVSEEENSNRRELEKLIVAHLKKHTKSTPSDLPVDT